MQKKVLIVEDEAEIRQLIGLHLKREGFDVTEAPDGEQGLLNLSRQKFDLLVLDWMLPKLSGLEMTRWVRGRKDLDRMPILFVTAKTEPEHIAAALDSGADDYMLKPFDTLVLMARVHALLRRHQWLENESSNKTQNLLKIKELVLDRDAFSAELKGEKLDLTRSEFKLLEAMMENQGKVLTRESLIQCIQGEGVNVIGRTIDTHIFGLRKKLGEYSDFVETIRGVGYRIRFLNAET